MEATFSELVSYFRQLAENHVEIKHSAAEKHFYRFELDEVLTGQCGDMNYPALILEGYTLDYSDSNSDNVIKQRSGAFILLDFIEDTKDFDAIHTLWDKLEAIGDDILIKIMDDKRGRQKKVIRQFEISNTQGQLMDISEVGQFGIRFSFDIGSSKNNEVDDDRWL